MRHPVIETLYELHDQIQRLTARETKLVGKELVEMWDCGTHGVETANHNDVTLSLGGLAKRVAEEYGFPGTFRD